MNILNFFYLFKKKTVVNEMCIGNDAQVSLYQNVTANLLFVARTLSF